jgi:hypothetical protein
MHGGLHPTPTRTSPFTSLCGLFSGFIAFTHLMDHKLGHNPKPRVKEDALSSQDMWNCVILWFICGKWEKLWERRMKSSINSSCPPSYFTFLQLKRSKLICISICHFLWKDGDDLLLCITKYLTVDLSVLSVIHLHSFGLGLINLNVLWDWIKFSSWRGTVSCGLYVISFYLRIWKEGSRENCCCCLLKKLKPWRLWRK